jgi:hypothetical protein
MLPSAHAPRAHLRREDAAAAVRHVAAHVIQDAARDGGVSTVTRDQER